MTGSELISSSKSQHSSLLRNIVDWSFRDSFESLLLKLKAQVWVKQHQHRHKSSLHHLGDVMWTPKSEAGSQLDPRGSGFLCVCTHWCLSNLRWHHSPFITGGGVEPCHLLSSLSTRPQRRKEEQRREGEEESRRRTSRHRYSLVELKHYVRHCRLLPHQIWHMFFVRRAFIKPTLFKCYHLAEPVKH